MKNFSPLYKDIKDWQVLETKTIYDFTPNENPIEVIKVLIGTLCFDEVDINQHYINSMTPITRWITRSEYKRLLKNEGSIIW